MFGLFKRKSTLEAQIETLQSCGFVNLDATRVLGVWKREQIEQDPYTLLLVYLGDEEEQSGEWCPRSSRVWHFDSECIEDHGDYARIAQRLAGLTQGDLPLENITDEVDVEEGKALLRFTLNGQTYEWQLRVDNDWVDPAVFSNFKRLLAERGAKRRLTFYPLGQDCLIGYANETELQNLCDKTGLSFRWLTGEEL